MNNIIIISAGSFGREVYTWAMQAILYGEKWIIKGFLDDRPNILDGFNYNIHILGSVSSYEPEMGDLFLCAIGDVAEKKRYCDIIEKKNGKFAKLIHPTAVLGPNVKISDGCIIGPLTQMSCEIEIGKHVCIGTHSAVGHDAKIGDYTQVSSHCAINGRVAVGKEVFIGSGAIIIPNLMVGDNAFIGAGSVVIKNVQTKQRVFGNPAITLV